MSKDDSQIQDSWKSHWHRQQRIQPQARDPYYFHFADLNDFIKSHAPQGKLLMLDYGSGSSPYREYFPCAEYRTADIFELEGLSYRIQDDATIEEKDNTFDFVFSTQVAEHVPCPKSYFEECFRLLKPGGSFMVTTHGVWEEHGVPFDFQRWTEEGLRRDLKAAGFQDIDIFKLTCGPRAGILLFTGVLYNATPPTSALPRLLFKAFRFSYSKFLPFLHRLCDQFWPNEKIVHAGHSAANPIFYVEIAAIAKKGEV